MNIYKVNDVFVNAENSVEAIELLKKLGKIKFTIGIEKICNTDEIIPTEDKPFMKLYKVNELFICASNEATALIKAHVQKPKIEFICYRDKINYLRK